MAYDAEEGPEYHRITEILGCRWSLAIFDVLEQGSSRPSQLDKAIDGANPRVLRRCLTRLEKDGLLHREVLAKMPPHVEYSLSDKGRRLNGLLKDLRRLASDW